MNYFEAEDVIPKFISFFKEMFKNNEDYHNFGPSYAKYPYYNSINLLAVDEDIAL